MNSNDGGVTWAKFDGTPITLPATSTSIDIIAENREGPGVGLRAGTIAVASDGRPHAVFSSYDRIPMETWWVTPDDTRGWQRTPLRATLPHEYADWGVTMPGGMTFSENGRLYITLTMIRPESLEDTNIWGHPSSEIVLIESDHAGRTFESRVLTSPNPTRPRWLPSLERQTGHNQVQAGPGLIYTDGGRGENNQQILSNIVCWLNL
jgi:hypothetical protein